MVQKLANESIPYIDIVPRLTANSFINRSKENGQRSYQSHLKQISSKQTAFTKS